MFLLNSRGHHFSATPLGSHCTVFTFQGTPSPEVTVSFCLVPSPKLSPRLGILYQSTCVGLQYGLLHIHLSGFSWKPGINNLISLRLSRHHSSGLTGNRTYLIPLPTSLYLDFHSPGLPSLLRHRIVYIISTGILTCFPSTTPLGLALGTD